MTSGLAFEAPEILMVLVALPFLWWLLRVMPPAPVLRRFPAVALLIGLDDRAHRSDRTPWWLLALRLLALAAAILGFAGPILAPGAAGPPRDTPILIVIDGGWAQAADWQAVRSEAASLVEMARAQARPVALALLAAPAQALRLDSPADLAAGLAGLVPQPWLGQDHAAWIAALPAGPLETFWLSDGLTHPGQAALLAELQARGPVNALPPRSGPLALTGLAEAEGRLSLRLLRPLGGPAARVPVVAIGPDPAGTPRELARTAVALAAGATEAEVGLDLPREVINRISRVEIEGQGQAGAVQLAADALRRPKVALVSEAAPAEGLALLSPLHYLERALRPGAEVIVGGLAEVLPARPDVVILADVASLDAAAARGLKAWLAKGGVLIRFAGPRMAAADPASLEQDGLMPVRLRGGGTSVGGAMSWGAPKRLAAFPEGSPFHGLALPGDLAVASQVLAQPEAGLAAATIASLEDGTPLVTRRSLAAGQVVLFHVTANAAWSNLPLTGLFVQMLQRLSVVRPDLGTPAALVGPTWAAQRVMDGFGRLGPPAALAGIAGQDLARALGQGPRPGLPPGLYAAEGRAVALNALGTAQGLAPVRWPAGVAVAVAGLGAPRPLALKGAFLTLALILALADGLVALWLSGRLGGARGWPGRRPLAPALALALVLALPLALGPALAPRALAQGQPDPGPAAPDDALAIAATETVVLAYVLTGDAALDGLSAAGLRGLGDQLWARTAIEPGAPMGVDPARDELAFFPFLYWPVTADAQVLAPATYDRLNRYLRGGGLILFDTRDAETQGPGGPTPEAQALMRLAAGLDIPPLEPVPPDHVLTRSFYLMQDFPGRSLGAPTWVEAAPAGGAQAAEGMPFRNLNDGVTPVVIGGNDWASAWAVDDFGAPLLPVGRGAAGERQREYAFRFGINLIMHVLTGNYKSDQVHVPALLERLGQ